MNGNPILNPILAAAFLASWIPMMAAMMLPSAAPMILLHRRMAGSPARLVAELRSACFVATYLAVWAAAGIAAWLLADMVDSLVAAGERRFATGAVLLLAGAYQLSAVKAACLRACRTPIDFLLTHWYGGSLGQLRLGVEHGAYCLGCCWALMAVFVLAGAMGLTWAIAIAVAVFVEKVVRHGAWFGRGVGVVLIVMAAAVVLRPDVAAALGIGV